MLEFAHQQIGVEQEDDEPNLNQRPPDRGQFSGRVWIRRHWLTIARNHSWSAAIGAADAPTARTRFHCDGRISGCLPVAVQGLLFLPAGRQTADRPARRSPGRGGKTATILGCGASLNVRGRLACAASRGPRNLREALTEDIGEIP